MRSLPRAGWVGVRVRSLVVVFGCLALLAACDSGDDTAALEQRIAELEQQLAEATSTTAAAVTTETTTTATSPQDGSGRVLFSGTDDCGFPEGLEETTEGDVTTYVGTIVCTVDVSDPRASGRLTAEITMVYLNLPGFEVNKWWASGPGTLTNDGGSWRLTEAFGADVWDETGRARTTGTEGYAGEGGYAGLKMRVLMAQGTNEPANAYVVVGWIEPAG